VRRQTEVRMVTVATIGCTLTIGWILFTLRDYPWWFLAYISAMTLYMLFRYARYMRNFRRKPQRRE
jgi:hypothetical protein